MSGDESGIFNVGPRNSDLFYTTGRTVERNRSVAAAVAVVAELVLTGSDDGLGRNISTRHQPSSFANWDSLVRGPRHSLSMSRRYSSRTSLEILVSEKCREMNSRAALPMRVRRS